MALWLLLFCADGFVQLLLVMWMGGSASLAGLVAVVADPSVYGAGIDSLSATNRAMECLLICANNRSNYIRYFNRQKYPPTGVTIQEAARAAVIKINILVQHFLS